jgi:hypothetical protein
VAVFGFDPEKQFPRLVRYYLPENLNYPAIARLLWAGSSSTRIRYNNGLDRGRVWV